MTQHRRQKDSISNYFDKLLDGIGHRGSSFTDLDAVTHDMKTDRVLIQEMKHPREKLSEGQRRTLEALSRIRKFTVWVVVKRDDGLIGWADFCQLALFKIISPDEYRARFKAWWDNLPFKPSHPAPAVERPHQPAAIVSPIIHPPVSEQLMDTDIPW